MDKSYLGFPRCYSLNQGMQLFGTITLVLRPKHAILSFLEIAFILVVILFLLLMKFVNKLFQSNLKIEAMIFKQRLIPGRGGLVKFQSD